MVNRKLKSPELLKARNALIKFIKNNNLDPAKDYSKDPKYGKEYKRLMITLQIERDKVMIDYPNQDIKNRKKYYKMKKDKKKAKAANEAAVSEATKKVAKKEVKKEKKEKKEKAPRTLKYDYPLIDGREMTSAEKKAYRVEQRKKAKGGEEKPKKEKKEKKAEAPAVDKKEKKNKKEIKVGKKDKKKKEED